MRGLPIAALSLFSCSAFAAPITLRLGPGKTIQYRVAVVQTETDAAGKKVAQGVSGASQMPVRISVQSRKGSMAQLQVSTGPLFALGRSVGRAKVRQMEVDATGSARGAAPSLFFVVLPPGGLRAGQSWHGVVNAAAPIPPGLVATYKMLGTTADGRYAKVSFTTFQPGATRVQGTGQLFLRTSDGCLDHGKLRFKIAYIRPDMKDRTKSVVNSTVVADYTITPN